MAISGFEAFIFGAAGSAGVELVYVLSCFNRGRFPSRFRRPMYWCARAGLVVVAGVVAYAHDVQTKILAIHLGIATPLILQAFSKAPPGDDEAQPPLGNVAH